MFLFDKQDSDLQIVGAYKTHPQAQTAYVRIKNNLYMHRVIMERLLSRKLERSEKVDHINGNGLDNRRENLRVVTHSQNLANRSMTRRTTNRFKGITQCKRTGKWQSKIMVDYKTIYLGTFKTDEEAAKEYDWAAICYFGDNAKLNFGVANV
jgi:hypothetical protein